MKVVNKSCFHSTRNTSEYRQLLTKNSESSGSRKNRIWGETWASECPGINSRKEIMNETLRHKGSSFTGRRLQHTSAPGYCFWVIVFFMLLFVWSVVDGGWTKERVSARKKWVRKKENKKNRRKKDRWVDRRGRQLPEPQTSPYPYSLPLIGGAVAISLDPTFVKINPLDKTASF